MPPLIPWHRKNKCAKLIYTPLSLHSVSFSSWQHPHERKSTDFTQFWRNRLISCTPSFPLYHTSESHALQNIMEVFSFSGLSGSFCLFGLSVTRRGGQSVIPAGNNVHMQVREVKLLTGSWCCPRILKKREIDLGTDALSCLFTLQLLIPSSGFSLLFSFICSTGFLFMSLL